MIKWKLEERVQHQMNSFKEVKLVNIGMLYDFIVDVMPAGF